MKGVWQNTPLLKIVLPLILGSFLAKPFQHTMELVFAMTIILALLAFSLLQFRIGWKWFRLCFPIYVLVLISAGMLWNLSHSPSSPKHFTHSDSKYLLVKVKWVKGEDFKRAKAEVISDSEGVAIYSSLLLQFKDAKIRSGEVILLKSEVADLKSSVKCLFNEKAFYESQDIWKKIALDKTPYVFLEHGKGAVQIAQKVRLKLLQSFNDLDAELKAVLSAMVLGHRGGLDPELKQMFVTSGTMHMLAVSGMHVAVVSASVFWMLILVRSKKLKTVLVLLVVWGYAYLVGFAVPVQRAALMASALSISYWTNRGSGLNALCLAALIVFIFEPTVFNQVGSQFSFLAVMGLLMFFEPLKNAYTSKWTLLNMIWTSTAASLSAQALIWPLILYHFHSFPTYGLLANLIIVPYLILLFYLGFIHLIFNFSLAWSLEPVLSAVWQWTKELIQYVGGLPHSRLFIHDLCALDLVWIYALLFLILKLLWQRKTLLGIAVICCTFVLLQIRSTNSDMSHRFMDPKLQKSLVLFTREKAVVLSRNSSQLISKSGQKKMDAHSRHFGWKEVCFVHCALLKSTQQQYQMYMADSTLYDFKGALIHTGSIELERKGVVDVDLGMKSEDVNGSFSFNYE